jgi:hypothetical protein
MQIARATQVWALVIASLASHVEALRYTPWAA